MRMYVYFTWCKDLFIIVVVVVVTTIVELSYMPISHKYHSKTNLENNYISCLYESMYICVCTYVCMYVSINVSIFSYAFFHVYIISIQSRIFVSKHTSKKKFMLIRIKENITEMPVITKNKQKRMKYLTIDGQRSTTKSPKKYYFTYSILMPDLRYEPGFYV